MKEKKRTHTIQKQYPVDFLKINIFKNSPKPYLTALLHPARFTLHKKSFLKDLMTKEEAKISKIKYDYCR